MRKVELSPTRDCEVGYGPACKLQLTHLFTKIMDVSMVATVEFGISLFLGS